MAFTLTQLEALERAIASGTLTVKYVDNGRENTVTFGSFADLRARYQFVAEQLGQGTAKIQTRVGEFRRDL